MTNINLGLYPISCAVLLLGSASPAWSVELPGPAPGTAAASISGQQLKLGNRVIESSWSIAGGKLRPGKLTDIVGGASLNVSERELFQVTLANGEVVPCSALQLTAEPAFGVVEPQPGASILGQRAAGQQFTASLASMDGNLLVDWRAILRDGANAIRQEIVLRAKASPIAIKAMRMVDLPGAGAKVGGLVPGCPLTVGNFFFAYEHPDTTSTVSGSDASIGLTFNLVLQPGQPVLQSSAVGVVPEGQMRRGFLYYVERESAHPYRPFLHYNAWYDICWSNRKITEAECLDVIDQFGRELIQKRGVKLDAFVWDDGWDDPQTLWRPVNGISRTALRNVLAAARARQSTLGFWLSPFGGYGEPKQARITMGKEAGFETGAEGFSLAGPKYYGRFLETCSKFISENGANFFKFDGLAEASARPKPCLL